jgi:hypothetical protein
MVGILRDLGLTDKVVKGPCQIEDLLGVSSPLDILYGIRRCGSSADVDGFRHSVHSLGSQMASIAIERREAAIEKAKAILYSQLESSGR